MIPNNQFRELEGWVCLLLAVLQGHSWHSWQLETQWEEEAGKSSQLLQQLLFLILCGEFPEHISKFWITDLETWAVPCYWAPPAATSLQLALWHFYMGDACGNKLCFTQWKLCSLSLLLCWVSQTGKKEKLIIYEKTWAAVLIISHNVDPKETCQDWGPSASRAQGTRCPQATTWNFNLGNSKGGSVACTTYLNLFPNNNYCSLQQLDII